MPNNKYPAVTEQNVSRFFDINDTLAKRLLTDCEEQVNWQQDSHDQAMLEFWGLAVIWIRTLQDGD